jgi:hypothetical protein
MRNKSELFKKEQHQISLKIIEILQLDNNNQITLYHLDNDTNKTQKIMNLIPDIRKYFSFSSISGVEYPNKFKRPWMSIIRHITKLTHTMSRKDKHLFINGDDIRTQLFTFTKK